MDIKVLHINTSDTIGGASQVAFGLVHNIDADCVLAVMKKESKSNKVIQLPQNFLDKIFLTIDKVIWKLGYKKSIKNILSISDQFNFTFSKLRKMKEYKEANIIHLHNIHGNYFDLSALRKIASEKYIVWTLHDMWIMTGGEAYTFKNDNYKKGIGETPYVDVYPLLNPLIDRRQHFIELKKKIYGDIADKLTLVPVSHWIEDCIKSAYVYNNRMNIRLNYNGINLSIFKNYKKRNWTKPRILFFNNESAFKGSPLFLNILNRLNEDYDLTIIGEPLKINVNYNYIKYIDNPRYLNEIYNDVDLLVFPSLAENFPLTLLEALACGVFKIASDVGGIPEVLDNASGYLFKSGDEEDLLNKINHALKNLAESRDKADEASRNVENFSLEKNCNGYLSIYKHILSYDNWKIREENIQHKKVKISINDFIKN